MAEHDDLHEARLDAAQEIAGGIVAAVAAAMTRHGGDPRARAVLATGFALAVRMITSEIDPEFQATLLRMLK